MSRDESDLRAARQPGEGRPDEPQPPLAGFARLSRRRVVLALGAAIVVGLGVAFVIGRVAEFGKVLDALRQADWRWLPLCLLGEIVSYGGYVLAYQDFARVRGGPRLPLPVAAEVVAVGVGATALGSTPGGLAVDYWALHKAGSTRRDAARRVLGLNTVKWLSLAALASIAGVGALLGAGSAPSAMALAWLSVVGLAAPLAIVLSEGKRGERLARAPAPPEPSASPARLAGRLGGFALREVFADSIGGLLYVRALYARPREHRAGVAGFPLYWAGDLACLWVSLRAFGVELDPATLVLAYATGYVATGLPLPVGGSGGVEAAMVFALTACGVELVPALLGVLCYRLFEFWLPLVPAVAVLPRLRGLERRLTELAARAS